jgi:N-methylhydantoinase A
VRVGIEVGGTFTDLILLDDAGGIVATAKVLSTPDDPARAVLSALDTVSARLCAGIELLHGSTVATNAVIERKGARTGLLTTSGFADLLELQRQDRERIYELQYRKPQPLVPRGLVAEIDERVTATGDVLIPLDEGQVLDAIRSLIERDVVSIAICLLHSYAHPEHERRIGELIRARFRGAQVSLSSEVVAEFREYERASTTTIDAFVKPVIHAYLSRLGDAAAGRGVDSILVMQSNGGLLPASYIREHPARTLFSGPAAGVTGAIRLAQAAGIPDIITMDMGGTSTDVCLVTGSRPEITSDATIDRLPIKVPMIDIISVGAGGGSIAWRDSGGMLQVGPRSAGAAPGPACYGLGGTAATTTDANVVRGLIRPGHFLGGDIELDVGAARAAIERAAAEIDCEPERFAEDVYRIATATMANAIRLVSTERGYDPRRYTLVAYGGAGPLHAASVAEQLDINRVLVPPYPGLLSAYGLLAGRFQRDFARTAVTVLATQTADSIRNVFADLLEQARREIAAYDIDPDECAVDYGLDMRYRGQGFELTLPLDTADQHGLNPADLAPRFHELHRTRYGHATPSEPIEVVTYRLSLTRGFDAPAALRVRDGDARPLEELPIVIDGRPVACQFHWRPSLRPGFSAGGPRVIEEPTATTFVPPSWSLRVDEHTNILLERTG